MPLFKTVLKTVDKRVETGRLTAPQRSGRPTSHHLNTFCAFLGAKFERPIWLLAWPRVRIQHIHCT